MDESTEQGTQQDMQAQDVEQPQANGDGTGGAQPETPVAKFTQDDVDRIVRERLDRERKRAEESAAKAAAEIERKSAEEQGEYKKLYEKLQADIAARDAEIDRMQKASWRGQAAKEVGLPDALVARIQGDTLDDMLKDAGELLKAIPKPVAPNINAGGGNGNTPRAGSMSEPEMQEFAARYGLSVESVKRTILGG